MDSNKLKPPIGLGLLCLLLASSANAQVYSGIVGYYNQPILAGDNFIANQLSDGGNTLTDMFNSPVPEGSTFTEWDPTTQAYLPTSVYDTSSGWSINYQLTYGQGGLFDATAAFTNTFVGAVWSGFLPPSPFVPPAFSSNGVYLLSCYLPVSATFYDVVGSDPQAGDSVTILDPTSQTETTTTFTDGAWDNGDPVLAVGESAFFDLNGFSTDASPTPEPGTLGLIGMGTIFLLRGAVRRRGYGNSTPQLP